MAACEWIKEFTAFVQLISAVNFTYMFTHFTEKIYEKIFSEDELINNEFSSFRERHLAKVKLSIENMDPIVINGHNTGNNIANLRSELENMTHRWEQEKNKIQQIISKNIKESKGIKSLFLYISIYCVFDMLNIALISTKDWRPVCMFVYITNILAAMYSAFFALKVILSSWKEKEDIYCFNKTRVYITTTIVLSICLVLLSELCFHFYGDVKIPKSIINISFVLCVILPMFPCMFSVGYILFNIVNIKIRMMWTKTSIWFGVKKLNRKKKKLEKAISTITDGVRWG